MYRAFYSWSSFFYIRSRICMRTYSAPLAPPFEAEREIIILLLTLSVTLLAWLPPSLSSPHPATITFRHDKFYCYLWTTELRSSNLLSVVSRRLCRQTDWTDSSSVFGEIQSSLQSQESDVIDSRLVIIHPVDQNFLHLDGLNVVVVRVSLVGVVVVAHPDPGVVSLVAVNTVSSCDDPPTAQNYPQQLEVRELEPTRQIWLILHSTKNQQRPAWRWSRGIHASWPPLRWQFCCLYSSIFHHQFDHIYTFYSFLSKQNIRPDTLLHMIAHIFPNIADFFIEFVSELSASSLLSIFSFFLLLLFCIPSFLGLQYETTSFSSN